MTILDRITEPKDLKKLNMLQLRQLAHETRRFLIESTASTGGHLSSNLGVVELTIALHYVFDSPVDKLVWDVGHQAYVHKLLTGRQEAFQTLRQFGGLSGFPKRSESEHDFFDTGHSSTSISSGLGLALARDLKNEEGYILPIIGDGALTGGMAYEALNNATSLAKKFIVILNDNQMSIDKNVGGMALYLDKFRTGQLYKEMKSDLQTTLSRIPHVGEPITEALRGVKNGVKQLLIPGMFFEEIGITYLGPVDGHDLRQLYVTLEQAKKVDGPVLVHVLTQKGKGYSPAEKNPTKFHGVKPFNTQNGEFIKKKESTGKTYSKIVGETLEDLAKDDPSVVAITAAMCQGTGLDQFHKIYPKRFFDVGIAEQHAVTFAGGLVSGGLKPYFVVYSSFLQRAYDQIVHDIALPHLPVTFCIDRAGLVGEDGETHQGVFDISFLSHIPGMTVMAPRSGEECEAMIRYANTYNDGPIAIRYPKGEAYDSEEDVSCPPIEHGEQEWIAKGKGSRLIISVGHFYERALSVTKTLNGMDKRTDLVSLRFIKPLKDTFIEELAKNYDTIYVLEESLLQGGVTSVIQNALCQWCSLHQYRVPYVYGFGIDNQFVPHGSVDRLNQSLSLDTVSIMNRITKMEEER